MAIDYATPDDPPDRSWSGKTAFVLSLIACLPASIVLLAEAGASKIAHDPTGDAGGPLFVLIFAIFTFAVAVLFAILWLLAAILTLFGLVRTRARCAWSRVAAVSLALVLGTASLAAMLIWKFVR